jgi:apolipoprotein N-acyltransferase
MKYLQNKFKLITDFSNKIIALINKKPKISLIFFASISIFAYAPFSIWVLMFISFVALNYILKQAKSSKQQLIWFSVYAYAFNVVNLHWVGKSFLYHSPEDYLVYLMPIIVAGMALVLTVLYILLFWILNKAKNGLTKDILLIPTVFLIAEFIRTLSVFGFPWNLVGYSIASNDYLLQASELGTVLVCSFLILFIASLIATFNKKYIIIASIIFVLWFTLGLTRFENLNKEKSIALQKTTKTIQLNTIKFHNFDRKKMHNQVLNYVKQVKKYKYKKDISLIVLPEMAMPYPINTSTALLNLLQRSIGPKQTLVVGSPAYNDYDIYNTMYFINKDGFKRYDKIMLVPFGEFMPFRNLLPFMKNFTNNFKDFSKGYIANSVDFNDRTFLGLICYEAIFPFFVKENISDKNNTVLMNITNDAWFHGTVAPYQHALIAKTRAVENNLPMVRVSNSGKSFIK